MFDNVKDNTIVICDDYSKKQILKSVNKIINIKFFSLDEFIKNLYFDYDEKAILYLVKKYDISIDIALEYLSNLIYVEDKKYNNDKLDFLVNIKNELIENKLLIFNTHFKKYIKDKEIIIYKYNLNKFQKHLLSDINYKVFDLENNNCVPDTTYEFNDIEEEIEFVAQSISKLLDQGVSIDKIKLTNISSDYINYIEKIFGFYNLKISKKNQIPITSTIVCSTFLNNIDLGVKSAIDSISSYSDTDIYNKIVNVCNKYVWCDNYDDFKLLVNYALNHTYIENINYTNEIEVVDLKSYNFSDEYVFLLGFNQGIIPTLKRDEDYINDSIKPSYMDLTFELNILEKNIILDCIKNIKNLIITYKLKTPFLDFYPSSLIEEMNLNVEHINLDREVSYSSVSDKLELCKYLDRLIKFGEKSDNLSLLNSNYDVLYNTYSNNFTGIDKNKIINYIKSLKEFNLSYSSMDNYNRCAFRFYVNKILCLDNSDNKFSVELGNIYHHILEIGLKNDINIKEEVYKYINENNIELDKSKEFFIDRTINNLEYLINVIKEQNKYSKMDNIETEKNIKIKIKDNINFIGFIDKIMYTKNQDEMHASIIDYKTYVNKPSLKYADYGIGLQLPTYMYLAKKQYKNIRFAGFYLQNIILDNKSLEDKKNSLKLIGYTNTDRNLLEEFDYNYKDSSVIDGIKINNDGSFSSNSLKKMLDDSKINDLIKLTENKITETINNVMDAKFDINPKYTKENIGCLFCEYKDICFMNASNLEKIKVSEVE